MNYETLGSNFIISSRSTDCEILLETDITIAKSGEEKNIKNLMLIHPDDGLLYLWLGLIKWWNNDYRSAWKLFEESKVKFDAPRKKIMKSLSYNSPNEKAVAMSMARIYGHSWTYTSCEIISNSVLTEINDAIRTFNPVDWRPYWYQALLCKDEIRTWDTWYTALGCFRSTVNHLLDNITILDPKFSGPKIYRSYLVGYHSQSGQDTMAEEFFKVNKPKYKKFVDIGAFDGLTFSNVKRFFDCGWTGLCVEPASTSFDALSKLYAGTGVKCIKKAVGSTDGMVSFEIHDNPATSQVSYSTTKCKCKCETVELITPNKLFAENDINSFDLISIDVENLNVEVLVSIDFKKYRPQLVIVEYNSNDVSRKDMVQFMRNNGYKLWFDDYQDLFFCYNTAVIPPNFWEIKTLNPKRV
jgi:FkbM family methyltransferase